jgi:uroporphyrinogen decarboxylase
LDHGECRRKSRAAKARHLDNAWIKLGAVPERTILPSFRGLNIIALPLNPLKEKEMESSSGSAFLRVLSGERRDPPPIWIMRQAGRYLPEYRALRTRAKSFLDFCYTPELAAEATLQPLRRFELDAAILFCDILVIPDALGRKVWFVEGEGPRLEPLVGETDWRWDDPQAVPARLAAVYETVRAVRASLPAGRALIGFAGGPWTVATYMLQGEGGDKARSRRAAYERPGDVDRLLDALVEATARHLAAQAEAGAQALQIFESWAGGLSPSLFGRLVLQPTAKLVARLRALGVQAPIIGFPREAGVMAAAYVRETKVDALGLDTAADAAWARRELGPRLPLQGNLDPQALIAGGAALKRAVSEVRAAFAGGPHIFNLGHGVTPETPPDHVAALIRLVKG